VDYPPAPRVELVEEVAGHRVADPYRVLEDPGDEATVAWSAAEDALTEAWLEGMADRPRLAERLAELMPGYTSAPLVIGDWRFWTARRPGQDHAVLWVGDAGDVTATSRALVDPNALSSDGTVTLDSWYPSIEGDRLAYLLSSGGDEESSLWVLDVASGEVVDGPIDRVRYGPVAWLPEGDQYFYVRRLAPEEVPAGEERYHRRLWLHRLGAEPSTDSLVFGAGLDPTAYIGVTTSDDGQWVAATVSVGTAPRNDVWLGALGGDATPAQPGWRPLVAGEDARAWPVFDRLDEMWLLTDAGAPRRRLLVGRPDRLWAASGTSRERSEWREVVVEDPGGAVLEDFAWAGDAIVVLRSLHGLSQVSVHDRVTGALRHDVALAGAGSASVTGRPDEGPEVWISYTDFATPVQVLHLDPLTNLLVPEALPAEMGTPPTPAQAVRSTQVGFRSADGTEIRLTLVAPAVDGERPPTPRPAILSGYGGFAVSETPGYRSSVLAWVEAGGVYAVAHLRGGGEEGEAWHRAGMREHKHHVFEDFEAAADWMVVAGWTTAEMLAIIGGSNGGLLVGAAITRSPPRYAAAVCSAPLLDMVRYERFGLGATWNDEFGRADDPTEVGWLLDYSPYHHVRDGVAYPAVLFTTFEGDTRVDPLHARKMCAALQEATTSDPSRRPVLLRRETDVGHGARSLRRSVDLAADQLAFLAHQVGLGLPAQ